MQYYNENFYYEGQKRKLEESNRYMGRGGTLEAAKRRLEKTKEIRKKLEELEEYNKKWMESEIGKLVMRKRGCENFIVTNMSTFKIDMRDKVEEQLRLLIEITIELEKLTKPISIVL